MFKKTTRLKCPATLGILAVSAPAEAERLKKSITWLNAQGFKIKIALNPTEAYGTNNFMFSSARPQDRAAALHSLFQDPEVEAILAVRGAYGCMEMLPYLDFDLISKYPKPLIGFSDVTALLVTLCQKSKIVTVHGVSAESMAQVGKCSQSEANCRALLNYLKGEQTPIGSQVLQSLCPSSKTAEGPLLLGNLSTINALMGTPYEPTFDSWILGLEEIAEKPYRIHRMLLQMKLAGKFKKLQAVVLGSFSKCEHAAGLGPTWQEVFQDIFKEYDIPVVYGAGFGHALVNYPIGLGLLVRIKDNKLEFLEKPVLD